MKKQINFKHKSHVVGRGEKDDNKINCFCPGYIRTSANSCQTCRVKEYLIRSTLMQRNARVLEHSVLHRAGAGDCDIVETKSLLNEQLYGLVDILPSVSALNSAVLGKEEPKRHFKNLRTLVEKSKENFMRQVSQSIYSIIRYS